MNRLMLYILFILYISMSIAMSLFKDFFTRCQPRPALKRNIIVINVNSIIIINNDNNNNNDSQVCIRIFYVSAILFISTHVISGDKSVESFSLNSLDISFICSFSATSHFCPSWLLFYGTLRNQSLRMIELYLLDLSGREIVFLDACFGKKIR